MIDTANALQAYFAPRQSQQYQVIRCVHYPGVIFPIDVLGKVDGSHDFNDRYYSVGETACQITSTFSSALSVAHRAESTIERSVILDCQRKTALVNKYVQPYQGEGLLDPGEGSGFYGRQPQGLGGPLAKVP